jgi:transglutaminase-like putative cysteine protease
MAETGAPDNRYLQPTEIIDSDHKDLIRFAKNVVAEATDPVERARRLFYAVRDGIVYDVRSPFFLPDHYRASSVLKRGRGFCVPKASVLCAAGRAMKIPARLGLADIRNHGASKQIVEMMGTDIFAFHGFVEFFLNGKWVKATPAFDAPIFLRHNIAPVEFDGEHHAVYPSHTLNGDPYVEYLVYHGSFDDVPIEALLAAWCKQYGEERMEFWLSVFENGQLPDRSQADTIQV